MGLVKGMLSYRSTKNKEGSYLLEWQGRDDVEGCQSVGGRGLKPHQGLFGRSWPT